MIYLQIRPQCNTVWMLHAPTFNAGHKLHFATSLLALSCMKSKANGPNTSLSDISYSRPGVVDSGAFGFQDKSMKGLRQAYVLGCLLCFGALSWILMPCHLRMRLPALCDTCFANAAHAEAQSGASQTLVLPSQYMLSRSCRQTHLREPPSALHAFCFQSTSFSRQQPLISLGSCNCCLTVETFSVLHPALQLLVSNLQRKTDSDNFADIAAGELQAEAGAERPC